MSRIMMGGLITLLLATGAFLFWKGAAAQSASLPQAPAARAVSNDRLFAMASPSMPAVPEASVRTREEKRFARADKDKDGKITAAELLAPRQKAFAKLDTDHNGALSFSEWAAKTIGKFQGADDDHSGWLTGAEYAETAPKPRAHPARCSC